jgi:carbon monoxide dehydrogenase subunit G
MEMQATRSLSVTQQQAWQALNDPEVLKLCIPGCDKVEATAEHEYDIGMALRIGPVSAKFKGHIKLSDIVPPASYRISFEGQGGPAGFGKGSAQVQLTPTDSGCELAYTVNASVGGKVAQLGQRLIDGAAKSLAEDFFKRFDDEMQRRHSAAPAAPAASSPPAGASSSSVLLPAVLAGVGGAVIMAAVLGLIWLAR